jgi:hypothetical protein
MLCWSCMKRGNITHFFYKQEIIAVREDGFLDFVGSFLCSGAKYFFII